MPKKDRFQILKINLKNCRHVYIFKVCLPSEKCYIKSSPHVHDIQFQFQSVYLCRSTDVHACVLTFLVHFSLLIFGPVGGEREFDHGTSIES